MKSALLTLNEILAEYSPDMVVHLSAADAELIATLGPFSLGELSKKIEELGACRAIEKHGLFGRRVIIHRSRNVDSAYAYAAR